MLGAYPGTDLLLGGGYVCILKVPKKSNTNTT